jgi:hypothetical protein
MDSRKRRIPKPDQLLGFEEPIFKRFERHLALVGVVVFWTPWPLSPLGRAGPAPERKRAFRKWVRSDRAQPFTNTRKRQPSGVTTPHPVAAYPRCGPTPLSRFSLYLSTRVPARDSNFLPLRLSRPACPASGRGLGPGRALAGRFRSGTDAGGGRPGRSGRAFHHRSCPRRPGRSVPFRPGRGDRGS